MNVVEPSVSTASRLRTRIWRLAICSAPQASERVTVGSSASGTRATVTPMAKMNPSSSGLPTSSEMRKKRPPTPRAITAVNRTTSCRPRVSGVTGFGDAVVSRAMPARRVCSPVATTTARPSPSTTNVPAYSASRAPTVTAALSPVSIEVSTRRRLATVTVASAGTRSPLSSSSRSSTTTSSASMICRRPSRRTVTRVGSMARRRSAARSALACWAKANTALSRMTAKMASPSSGRRATMASAPATHSMSAKKWVSSPANRRAAEGRRGSGSRFGPCSARRAAASAVLRPVAVATAMVCPFRLTPSMGRADGHRGGAVSPSHAPARRLVETTA